MQGVNNIEITDAKIKRLNNLGRLLGEASITLNNCLVIHNIKILQLSDKRILSFPCRKLNNEFVDVVHPITREFRNYVESYIFDMFDNTEVEE